MSHFLCIAYVLWTIAHPKASPSPGSDDILVRLGDPSLGSASTVSMVRGYSNRLLHSTERALMLSSASSVRLIDALQRGILLRASSCSNKQSREFILASWLLLNRIISVDTTSIDCDYAAFSPVLCPCDFNQSIVGPAFDYAQLLMNGTSDERVRPLGARTGA
jgi:hypothetical protein